MLIRYANQHRIILELNKKKKYGNYPFCLAICKNNIKMVKLLIEYANQHQIILEMNVKNDLGYYPLLEVIYNKNIEIVKLLIEYAHQHHIILKYEKTDFYFESIIIINLL